MVKFETLKYWFKLGVGFRVGIKRLGEVWYREVKEVCLYTVPTHPHSSPEEKLKFYL